MKRIIRIAMPFALALAASAAGPAALAQGTPGKVDAGRPTSMGYEVTAEMQRYREVAELMRDMSRQMNKLQESMAKGEMSAASQKRSMPGCAGTKRTMSESPAVLAARSTSA